MHYKPWPIIILAMIHLLEPFVKLPMYSMFLDVPLINLYTFVIAKMTFTKFMLDYMLFPIMGFAILRVKPWSLVVVVLSEIIVAAKYWPIFRAFLENQQYGNFSFFLFLFLLNILVVFYFLYPAVRKTYLDSKVRWWEHKNRYRIPTAVTMTLKEVSYDAEIVDISESGIFVKSANELIINSIYYLSFNCQGMSFSIYGELVHERRDQSDYSGFGVKFYKLSLKDKFRLKRLACKLESAKVPRRPERIPASKRFMAWLKALTRGEGIFPKVG